jgi:hypothetical protein
MSSKKRTKCSFGGCRNKALKDRMYCAEHLSSYDVPKVAARRPNTFTENLCKRAGRDFVIASKCVRFPKSPRVKAKRKR